MWSTLWKEGGSAEGRKCDLARRGVIAEARGEKKKQKREVQIAVFNNVTFQRDE